MASSPEEAYAIAHKNDTFGFDSHTYNADDPKIKEEIERLAKLGYTPELDYANLNLDTSSKIELVKPGDDVYVDGVLGKVMAGYPAGTMNIIFADCSVKRFDDVRNNIDDIKLKNNPAVFKARGEHTSMIPIAGMSSEYAKDEDGNRNIDLSAFDYPKNSSYSCCLTTDGKEYYIRKMHKDEDSEDPDFDANKDEHGGGCYELIPSNHAAMQRTHGESITISGDALKRKMSNDDSEWEYSMYSNEKESDFSMESRYLNTQTAISNILNESSKLNDKIKDLENKSKNSYIFGLRLPALKNKRKKLIGKLNQLSKISDAIIPNENDIESWIMKNVFE